MTLLVLYIILAIGVSFICSIFEAVLLSVTPSYIANLKQQNRAAAERLGDFKNNIDAPLVAILTLNTIAHTVGAAGAGAQAASVFGNDIIGLFSAILTLAILFLSEIIPKTLGANYWRQLAPSVSLGLKGLITATKPFIWISLKMTNWLGKSDHHHYVRAELSAMADVGAESGELNQKESEILKQMLLARDTAVTSIMTPRTVICALPQTMSLRDFAHQHRVRRFSRIPVFNHDQDDIVGYVTRAEVLLAEKYQPEAELRTLRRPIIAIPESVRLLTLFELLLKKHNQIAIVVDEYGSVRGLVTMEDIVESMLGAEIVDSNDPAIDMQQVAKKLWRNKQRKRNIRISEDNGAE